MSEIIIENKPGHTWLCTFKYYSKYMRPIFGGSFCFKSEKAGKYIFEEAVEECIKHAPHDVPYGEEVKKEQCFIYFLGKLN